MTTYNWHFSQTGNDISGDGTVRSPWETQDKLNDELVANMLNGDTFNCHFKRGDRWSNGDTIGVNGSTPIVWKGNNILNIGAYGNGSLPTFDSYAMACQIVAIDDTNLNNFSAKNLRFEGQNRDNKNDYINLVAVDNINIDGIQADGHATGKGSYSNGDDGIWIKRGKGDIEIKNCDIINLGPDVIPTHETGDVYAIYISRKTEGTWSLHDCLIHDINADAIQIKGASAKSSIYKNEFFNCGENAIDIKKSHNIDVHHNNFYRTPNFIGHGGIGGSGTPLVSMITSPEGASIDGSINNIVRDNYLHHNPEDAAVYVGFQTTAFTCENNKIYRNIIELCGVGVTFGTSAINCQVHNNLVVDSLKYGFLENNDKTGNKIYNNTFVNRSATGKILRIDGSLSEFRNNIFCQIDSTHLILENSRGNQIFTNNLYCDISSGIQDIISYKGITYDESQQAKWRNAGHSGAIFSNPLFVNAANGDFRLAHGSPAIEAGIDVGLPFTGLRPDIGAILDVPTDPCEGVICPNICIGPDIYTQKCVDGICVADQLLESNSTTCGYDPCEGVNCPNICIGDDLWSQKCADGVCVADELIEVNSVACTTDPCDGVVCPDICIGPDLWSQICDPATGQCTPYQLLHEDSINCKIADAVHTDDSNIATYLVIGGLGLTGLALFLLGRNKRGA